MIWIFEVVQCNWYPGVWSLLHKCSAFLHPLPLSDSVSGTLSLGLWEAVCVSEWVCVHACCVHICLCVCTRGRQYLISSCWTLTPWRPWQQIITFSWRNQVQLQQHLCAVCCCRNCQNTAGKTSGPPSPPHTDRRTGRQIDRLRGSRRGN